tara:strand:- start:62 stop:256 length:195 start_codon:yes stop_codon:yes gene_type:complete
MTIQNSTIDEGEGYDFECHDLDDMQQLLNYLEKELLYKNLDVPIKWNYQSRVKLLKKAINKAGY